jgi:hypothetical protein
MTAPGQTQQLERAALVSVSAAGARRAVTFQYNPDTVRRTIEPNLVGGRPGSRSRVVRFAGAAAETLTLDCRFSTSGGQDSGDPNVASSGIAPTLAALSLLAYPSVSDVLAAQTGLDDGKLDVIPPAADELLLVFGSRVAPCQIETLAIAEELYDTNLVPVLATVTMTLRLLNYSDVDHTNPAFSDFVSYQSALEQLARSAYDTRPGPT